MDANTIVIGALFGLFTKHFVLDFLTQGPYQYMNKGIYGHPGGVLHSVLHAIGTYVVMAVLLHGTAAAPYTMYLALADFMVHYHVDWAKTNINDRYGWKCNGTNPKFWMLLGLDQYLQSVTYLAIVTFVMVKVSQA